MEETLFFWAHQYFIAQLSHSPCFASFLVNAMEMVPCKKEIASYSWHVSVVALSNHLFPAPSTPFTIVKWTKSLALFSQLFAIILRTTVALAALRRVGANSCVWARQQQMIHEFLWECTLLILKLAIRISKKIEIDQPLSPSYHSHPVYFKVLL